MATRSRALPDGVDRLVLSAPQRHMAQRLARRLDRLGRDAQIVRAPAEALPFDDATFDTVVSTLVLCTVADPEASLDEIRRVLRPDGALLFLDHVRDGCCCHRRTPERLSGRGYAVSAWRRGRWRRMPPIVRPLVAGRAVPRSPR